MDPEKVLRGAMPGGPSPFPTLRASIGAPSVPRLPRQEWAPPSMRVIDLTIAEPVEVRSWLDRVGDVLRSIARAVRAFLDAVLEAWRVAMPVLLLVNADLAERARYGRRMEAHYHRTAGRARSRRRPGRR